MNNYSLIKLGSICLIYFSLNSEAQTHSVGKTEITKWQDNKKAAVSITYDDGNVNQFKVAIPLMDRLQLPGTFFIMTGQYAGSKYQGKFIGREVSEIIKETATLPTSDQNFFERASAVPYLGFIGPLPYHVKAGSAYEAGNKQEAFQLIDDVYSKVRKGEFKAGIEVGDEVAQAKGITWDQIRAASKNGHEFASHTITHHMTPVLDEANLLYELEKSKEDIRLQLGAKYTFSAECSYGVEDPRVMKYALKVYPALRNRMPEPYMEELNRSSKQLPGFFNNEYVQWQRGATTKTSMPLMKSWVDTVLSHQNNWLVLVIHGVDGMGWEAMTHQQLQEIFNYLKDRNNQLWIATFADVTKYMRERKSSKITSTSVNGHITVKLNCDLDKFHYNVPLTLKTYVKSSWKKVTVVQGRSTKLTQSLKDKKGTYVFYQSVPGEDQIVLSGI
jgi:peptidoglycan/xylan/chitin deacetylase (PgdA/CDA1 family)